MVYVFFALFGGGWQQFPLELLGLVFYGSLAWLSKKYSLIWLAVGWGLHVCWDVFLHSGPSVSYVPDWYIGLCLGFDIIIAFYIGYVYCERKQAK